MVLNVFTVYAYANLSSKISFKIICAKSYALTSILILQIHTPFTEQILTHIPQNLLNQFL